MPDTSSQPSAPRAKDYPMLDLETADFLAPQNQPIILVLTLCSTFVGDDYLGMPPEVDDEEPATAARRDAIENQFVKGMASELNMLEAALEAQGHPVVAELRHDVLEKPYELKVTGMPADNEPIIDFDEGTTKLFEKLDAKYR